MPMQKPKIRQESRVARIKPVAILFMNSSDKILERLLGLHPKLIDLSLGRIERLLYALGNPHLHLAPVIHIAGTNGKGSTLAFLRAMLEAAGKRVHVYTSPHLVRFHERILLAGSPPAPIAEAELAKILEHCEKVNEGAPITFFEITTAAAFYAFSKTPADYVLLETGLGGRFDATNVIPDPALTLISTVSHDHHEFLGDSLVKIAFEKAGIIKAGTACITGPQDAQSLQVIEKQAAVKNAPLLVHGSDWQVFEQHGRLVYQDGSGLLDLPLPAMSGRYQVENAGLAIAALRAINPPGLDESHMAKGLRSARWPARMQRLQQGKLPELVRDETEIWLDGGHNPAAAQALCIAMGELEERSPKPLCLILAMMQTKDRAGFLAPFAAIAAMSAVITIPGEPNAAATDDLLANAREQGLEAYPAKSLAAALKLCDKKFQTPPRILITGSLYLAGHVLRENNV